MEAERDSIKHERQEAKKNTAKKLLDQRVEEASKARETNPFLAAMFEFFIPGPGPGHRGRPKFIKDKYGNRIPSGFRKTGK